MNGAEEKKDLAIETEKESGNADRRRLKQRASESDVERGTEGKTDS